MATEKPGKDLRASIKIEKPILYLDMDGVLCDFDLRHEELLKRGVSKQDAFDHPEAYLDLRPIPDAIPSYHELEKHYEVYILSTASWDNLSSWREKRVWVEDYLGDAAKKKLILSHNKGLLKGDVLVDDRIANGVADFEGEHIHFGSAQFPNWKVTLEHLIEMASTLKLPKQ